MQQCIQQLIQERAKGRERAGGLVGERAALNKFVRRSVARFLRMCVCMLTGDVGTGVWVKRGGGALADVEGVWGRAACGVAVPECLAATTLAHTRTPFKGAFCTRVCACVYLYEQLAEPANL